MPQPKLIDNTPITKTRKSIRIGWRQGIEIYDPPPGLLRLIKHLDGNQSLSQLRIMFPMISDAQIDLLLTQLTSAGLLARQPEITAKVLVMGEPSLAIKIAEKLAETGVSVRFCPRLANLKLAGTPVPVGNLSQADLIILVSLTIEPDPQTLFELDHCPLLLIRANGTGTLLGPIIKPGVSACLNCIDLELSQSDPDWAAHRLQLAQIKAVPRIRDLVWVANFAALEAVSFLTTDRSSLLAATAFRDRETNRLVFQHWLPHPRCRCIQQVF